MSSVWLFALVVLQAAQCLELKKAHIVQVGETLQMLSQQYNLPEKQIAAANGIAGDIIYPGQDIQIPGGVEDPNRASRTDEPMQLSPQDISFAIITGGKHHRDRAQGVIETWCRPAGLECVFFSDTPDAHLRTVVYNSTKDYAGAQLRFLPALRYMKQSTHSKWVVLLDDDTYVFVYNLMHRLNSLADRADPIYMGLLEPVNTWSKQIRGKATDTSFVNGGSGAVFNRKALDAMDLDQCIRQQEVGGKWEGWQSDWMVGACCKQHGIGITNDDHFIQWPANGTREHPISIHMIEHKDKMHVWHNRYSQSLFSMVPAVTMDHEFLPVDEMNSGSQHNNH